MNLLKCSMPVYAFMPQRLGGLDFLLPLFLEIKHHEPMMYVEAIFIGRTCFEQLKKDKFLFDQFSDNVDRITFLPDTDRSGPLKKSCILGLKLAGILLRVLMTKAPRIFCSDIQGGWLTRVMSKVGRLRGGLTFCHSKSMVFLKGRLPTRSVKAVWSGDGFLCCGLYDEPFHKQAGHTNIESIGYPKLFDEWQQVVRENGGRYLQEDLGENSLISQGRVVSLFLGSTVPEIFSLEELEDWLASCVLTVQKKLPGSMIVVKPHPMQEIDHLNQFIHHLESPNTVVSFLNASVLASQSDLVIAHHTSTIIDAVAFGVPTIQYQFFSEHWLRRHPEGSSFLHLQHLWAQNKQELEEKITEALSESYRCPDLPCKLGHRKNLDPILSPRGEEIRH